MPGHICSRFKGLSAENPSAVRRGVSWVAKARGLTVLGLLEIHVGKGLPVGVLYHKAAIQFPD